MSWQFWSLTMKRSYLRCLDTIYDLGLAMASFFSQQDGPSVALLKYMERFNYEALCIW